MKNDRRIEELHKLYKEDNAKKVLDWMASRGKNAFETVLDKLVETLKLERPATFATLRRFEEIGMGKLIIGRRGGLTRFVWAVGFVSAGKAAQGEMQALENLPALDEPGQPAQAQYEGAGNQIAAELMESGRHLTVQGISIELTPKQISQIMQAGLKKLLPA